jgi:ornithine carbamoyltransferase
MDLHGRSLLKEIDLAREEFLYLVKLGDHVRRAKQLGLQERRLAGRNIALIFEKASTRIRSAFEVAAHDEGAHVTYIGPEESQLGYKESMKDTARVLGRMFDGIEYRGFSQESIEILGAHAGTLLGMDARICAPAALQPAARVQTIAKGLAAGSGARLTVTDDLAATVHGADFLYTDVWLSMGEPAGEWDARIDQLIGYPVNEQVMAATGNPKVKFMHCLPALHNLETDVGRQIYDKRGLAALEVTDEVFESPQSVVFDQAANRMHTIKAVMVATIGTPT